MKCKSCGHRVTHSPYAQFCLDCRNPIKTRFSRQLIPKERGINEGCNYAEAVSKAARHWPYLNTAELSLKRCATCYSVKFTKEKYCSRCNKPYDKKRPA